MKCRRCQCEEELPGTGVNSLKIICAHCRRPKRLKKSTARDRLIRVKKHLGLVDIKTGKSIRKYIPNDQTHL